MRREKKGEKSEWLYGLLNPKSNIIVRAPLLSSSHQILLLVLIENPWGPSWKQYSALEKMIQKMSLSFLSKCCVWGLQHLDSQFNYFSWKGRERQRERGWREFIDNLTYLKWLWPWQLRKTLRDHQSCFSGIIFGPISSKFATDLLFQNMESY